MSDTPKDHVGDFIRARDKWNREKRSPLDLSPAPEPAPEPQPPSGDAVADFIKARDARNAAKRNPLLPPTP